MATVGGLFVNLQTNVAEFQGDMGKAAAAVNSSSAKINRRLSGMQKHWLNLTKNIKRSAKSMLNLRNAIGLLAGTSGLGLVISRSLDAASAIKDLSQRAGVSVTTFQEMTEAGRKFNIQAEDMADGIKELQLRADEFAKTGSGPAAEAFERLGFSQTNIANLKGDFNSLFNEVVRGFQDLEDSAAKARVLDELFGGTAGERFRGFLDEGVEGIKNLRKEAQDTSRVLGEDFINEADKLNDRLKILGTSLKKSFASGLIESFSGEFTNFSDAAKDPALADSMKSIGKLAGDIAKNMGTAAKFANQIIKAGSSITNTIGNNIKVGAQQFGLAPRTLEDELSKVDGQIALENDRIFTNTSRIQELEKKRRDLAAQLVKIRESRRLRSAGTAIGDQQFGPNNIAPAAGGAFSGVPIPGRKPGLSSAPLPGQKPAIAQAMESGSQEARKLERQIIKVNREAEQTDRTFADMGATFSSAFEDAVISGQKLSGVLRGLAQDIQRLVMRKLVTDPISSALSSGLGSLFGGGGGVAPGAFAAAGGAGSIGVKPRAMGGPFGAADTLLVGERGPEIVKFGRSGTVVPNNRMGQSSGGPVFNIDARGASVEAVARLEQMVQNLNGSIESRSLAATQNQYDRNPEFLR